ncbi:MULTISPECIES: response regulator transcription factor [unclassified Streptomyces]|uniref:response regulator transcription factor n=1 Tax=unclassified Streptomyces TaxID=2593676 RepID=UPI002DD926D7|nr:MULTISPECIES: response regulator transcription factor [unclassified Streptomyces]WSA97197.1 response regulator transcription factor [Streptomyces sp. NBC_01795]WSB81627.1 response regulator transcription factor [Streptomyces sp. NBC_01775]WSS17614.1 response regulator transcription factor [Streptomyces sp. NBC_01186]WSS46363.1 response regulator transcription factor [Streptomyces sp. NBC_01187]
MRVVIAEDAVVVREGLVGLLTDRDVQVLAAVGDPEALLEAVEHTRPDAVVADIRMPPTHRDEGLRAAAELRSRHPELGILLFSQYIETSYAHTLLASGPAGIGYLLKDRVLDVDDFVEALHRVVAGGTALDPDVISRLLRTGPSLSDLTAREHETLTFMAEGLTNAAIADRMRITQRAVEKHTAAIFDKLDIPRTTATHRRVQAVLRFVENPPPAPEE